jgi:hypothetical protein
MSCFFSSSSWLPHLLHHSSTPSPLDPLHTHKPPKSNSDPLAIQDVQGKASFSFLDCPCLPACLSALDYPVRRGESKRVQETGPSEQAGKQAGKPAKEQQNKRSKSRRALLPSESLSAPAGPVSAFSPPPPSRPRERGGNHRLSNDVVVT